MSSYLGVTEDLLQPLHVQLEGGHILGLLGEDLQRPAGRPGGPGDLPGPPGSVAQPPGGEEGQKWPQPHPGPTTTEQRVFLPSETPRHQSKP